MYKSTYFCKYTLWDDLMYLWEFFKSCFMHYCFFFAFFWCYTACTCTVLQNKTLKFVKKKKEKSIVRFVVDTVRRFLVRCGVSVCRFHSSARGYYESVILKKNIDPHIYPDKLPLWCVVKREYGCKSRLIPVFLLKSDPPPQPSSFCPGPRKCWE